MNPASTRNHTDLPPKVQKRLNKYKPTNPKDDTTRFLQIVNKNLPPAGQKNLTKDITSSKTDATLRNLASGIDTCLLRPMKAFGGKTPENEIDEPFIDDDDIEDPVTVLRGRIRRRDGYRCLISGVYDCATSHLWNIADPAGVSADLDVGYIIPYSIIRSLKCDDNDDERRRQAEIWKILYRYFPDSRDILDTLKSNESDMDDTLNVMMIEKCLHREYGGFHMTLEKRADMENKYHIKTFPSFVAAYSALLPLDGLAILSPRDGDRYKLPNQALLGIHASVANILHATGRARMVDGLLDQYRRCMRLRWDGGTDVAGLLSVSQLGLLAPFDFC